MQRTRRNRGEIGYVDVILTFATFAALAIVSPFLTRIIDMLRSQVDPLTSVLVGLLLPLFAIGILYSMGVSARR